jgi:hypothetical protein
MLSAIKTLILWCVSLTVLLALTLPIALFVGFNKIPTNEND